MDATKILDASSKIRNTLSEYTIGWANTTAKGIVDKHVADIKYATAEPYLLEKVATLSSWLDILFSARKHQKHGGSATVKQYVLEDLYKIEGFLKSRQPARGEPGREPRE